MTKTDSNPQTNPELEKLADAIITNKAIRDELLDIVFGTNYRWHNFIKDLHIQLHENTALPAATSFETWKQHLVEESKRQYTLEQRDNFSTLFLALARILRNRNTKDKDIYDLIHGFERDRRLTLFPVEWDEAKLQKYLGDALDLIQVQQAHPKIIGCIDEALATHDITSFDAGSRITQLIESFKDGVNEQAYSRAVEENATFMIEHSIQGITTHENCGASALVFNTYIKPLLPDNSFFTYFMSPDEIARKFALDTIAKIHEINPQYKIYHEFIQASDMDRPVYEHIAGGITVAPGEIIRAMYEANPKYPYTFNVDTGYSLETVALNVDISLSIAFGAHGRVEEYVKQPFVIIVIAKDEKERDNLLASVHKSIKAYADKSVKVISGMMSVGH